MSMYFLMGYFDNVCPNTFGGKDLFLLGGGVTEVFTVSLFNFMVYFHILTGTLYIPELKCEN